LPNEPCDVKSTRVRPRLFTFDVFGTIVDWRAGLREALGSRPLSQADFDRLIGLTRVFVRRPHCRPGEADHAVADLAALADLAEKA